MKLADLPKLGREDEHEVRVGLVWYEPLLRPPPRTDEQVWDVLYADFAKTDEAWQQSPRVAGHLLCNYLAIFHERTLLTLGSAADEGDRDGSEEPDEGRESLGQG